MKIIVRVASLHNGRIIFDENDISHEPPEKRILRGIGYLPQLNNIFPDLTVEENLELGGYHLAKNEIRDRINRVYELFPLLKERRRLLAGSLSGGERQMLAIGRVLMSDPKLIIFDEPSAGLAPKIVVAIFDVIKKIREMGKTIILIEQLAKKALENSDRGVLMRSGRIVLIDESKKLLSSEELGRTFLGI
ncbi:MAG: ATP-binding cassette domain-containing protein [Desulfurococcales archaeon]|jgi:ABC-type branched-subunit amino acid transport system ATPase component|nr:ATP-binding cassette domain-containing protein [Desulfurococcales archaeon]